VQENKKLLSNTQENKRLLSNFIVSKLTNKGDLNDRNARCV
jgi:hypothetical protein